MNKYKLIAILTGLVMMSSCTDFGDTNVDPDVSLNAKPEQVMTSAQGYLAWVVDGQYNNRAFLWGQYWTWGPGVSLGDNERYVMTPTVTDNVWNRSYSNALADLKYVSENGNSVQKGAAKVMTALLFQMLVDHFGNIPFSEALKGEIKDGAIQAPAYDKAEDVYASLAPMLQEAVTDLNGSGTMGDEDLIYGGDVSKWIKFANSLQLRILMRQSSVSDQSAKVKALVSSADFIESGDDIAQMAFTGSSGSENPMFASQESGIGNFYVASNACLDLLKELQDPRIGDFYDVNGAGVYAGVNQGAIDSEPFGARRTDYSQGSAITYGKAVTTILVSDWEVWFLRAEAAVKYGTSDNAQGAFENAVSASFDYLGNDGAADFIPTLGFDKVSDVIKMNIIGIQKWISMNGLQESEGWIEARRFDRPGARIFTDAGTGIWQTPPRTSLGPAQFPGTWLYPQGEQSFNPKFPGQRLITDKVFWDN